MIGVDMGFQRVAKIQAEFVDECKISFDLFIDRVDYGSLAGLSIPQQIAVGAGFRVEQLTDLHATSGLAMRQLTDAPEVIDLAETQGFEELLDHIRPGA